MTRKQLEDLGLDKEIIDTIMSENGKDITKAKGNYEELKSQYAEATATIDTLKANNADNEKLQEAIKTHEATIKKLEADAVQKDFTYRLDESLKGAKVKNLKAVKALLNLETLSIDGDGLKGLSDQLKALQESDAYLFDVEETKPIIAGATPTNKGGSRPQGGITKEQFQGMGYKDRMQLFTENQALYEELTQ